MKYQWPTALLHVVYGTGVITGISLGAWLFQGSDIIRYGSLIVVAFGYYELATSIKSWRRQTTKKGQSDGN